METEFLEWVKGRLAVQRATIGPGDDAAVLADGTVVATDLLCDGVHFRAAMDDPRRIGRKAVAVNLSDVAAMAARPTATLVSLCLPQDWPGQQDNLRSAQAILEGAAELADQFGAEIVGGDTNVWAGGLVVNVAVLGRCPAAPLLRNGGRPGDHLLVTGELGGSLLGKHFDFQPRVAEAAALQQAGPLTAGMDVSDGLSLDVSRLAAASGCGAVLDADAIPIAEAARTRATESGRTPLEHALSDGEDFELLLAAAPEVASRLLARPPVATRLTCIGQLIESPGLWLEVDGTRRPLTPRGFLHGENG